MIQATDNIMEKDNLLNKQAIADTEEKRSMFNDNGKFGKSLIKLYIIGFIGTLGLLLFLLLALPKANFSYFENRYLQNKLELSWQSLLDKSFAEDAEHYVADQFPWRKNWFALKAFAEQSRLMTINNGIYLGKEHFLFEAMKEPNREDIEQYVDSINKFIDKFPAMHSTLLLVPTSVELYPQLLPDFASSSSQQAAAEMIASRLSNKATYLDGIKLLLPYAQHTNAENADSKPIYYRNDHHWSSYGAYLAYAGYMKQLGITPLSLEQFEIKEVSTSFRGSYHTKGQFVGTKPDTIERYDSGYIESHVHIADDDSTMDSLYDESRLAEKDQYNYFGSGVHGLMTITNELTAKGKAAGHQFAIDSMLVIKDSYAHAMLPFLSQHVREIHVIDTRYFNTSIEQFVKEHPVQETLLLYNIPTFTAERSLLKLKR